jgi:radical SAM protein with 4Fe4S-binding SPASM domain
VRVRHETWGAWLRSDVGIVALDHDGVRALGLEPPASLPLPAPLEVHLAVTSRCAAGCEGCYLDARPDGDEPGASLLEQRLDAMSERGVFTVAFGGGEPTLRDDLGALAEHASSRGLTPVVTTSGLGLGPRKLEQLRRFAQVNVSYDGGADDYEAVRGFDGAAQAEKAISELASAGVKVGVNVVLTRDTYSRLANTIKRALDCGASEVQLLRYKPAGRAKNLDYLARRLSPEQVRDFPASLRRMTAQFPEIHLRIDCALVPFLSTDRSITAEQLERWGVFGCEAGHHLAAQRVDGAMLPCSFAAASDSEAFLAFIAAPAEPCASCTLRPVCRGGCKVVAQFVSSQIGPDPECPRVQASR